MPQTLNQIREIVKQILQLNMTSNCINSIKNKNPRNRRLKNKYDRNKLKQNRYLKTVITYLFSKSKLIRRSQQNLITHPFYNHNMYLLQHHFSRLKRYSTKEISCRILNIKVNSKSSTSYIKTISLAQKHFKINYRY